MSKIYLRLHLIFLGAQIVMLGCVIIIGITWLSCSSVQSLAAVDVLEKLKPSLTEFFSIASFELNGLLDEIFLSSPELAGTESKVKLANAPTSAFVLLLFLTGLLALLGALGFFARRRNRSKDKSVCLHLSSRKMSAEPLVIQKCMTCGVLLRYPVSKLAPEPRIWIIEIIVTTAMVRKASTLAIKELGLPVIRRENNLIVLGTYRNKVEPSVVIRELKDRYNVRGWVVQGN